MSPEIVAWPLRHRQFCTHAIHYSDFVWWQYLPYLSWVQRKNWSWHVCPKFCGNTNIICILGQSKSSDVDMALYNECRQKDRLNLHQTFRYENYQAHDTLKLMVGDHPARTMEKGHQRGDGYSCPCGAQSSRHRDLSYIFRTASNKSSLQDCTELLLAGNATQDKMAGSMAPLKNLGINDLKDGLEARDCETGSLRKPELQEMLQDILHGTQKLPAILSNTNHSLKTLNCEKYEVVNLEPLHEIGQLIMNIVK